MSSGSMPLREVKNHLSDVVDRVERERDRVVITKHGRPAAVVMNVDDLESLEETLAVMTRPALLEQITESLTEAHRKEATALTKDEALRLLEP